MKDMGAFAIRIPETNFNNEKLNTKSSLGYYIPTNSIQFTKRYKIKHYYIGRNGKNAKSSKSQMSQTFLQGLRNFARVAKICKPCEFGKVAYAFLLILLLPSSNF